MPDSDRITAAEAQALASQAPRGELQDALNGAYSAIRAAASATTRVDLPTPPHAHPDVTAALIEQLRLDGYRAYRAPGQVIRVEWNARPQPPELHVLREA